MEPSGVAPVLGGPGSSLSGFDQLLRQHPDPAWIVALDGLNLLAVNDAVTSLTGYSRDECVRMTMPDFLHPEDAERFREAAARAQSDPGPATAREKLRLRSREGHELVLEASAHTLEIDGRRCRLIVARPASGRPPAPSEAAKDRVTGLPTRGPMLEELGQRIQKESESPSHLFAILLIDIDRFRRLNDSLGTAEGDRLLGAVARRLETCVGSAGTVARLEGDSFGVLLDEIYDPEDAVLAARRIQEAFEGPFALLDQDFFVTVSIGVVASGTVPRQPEEFLRDAEVALRQAKSRGPGGCEMYDPEMQAKAARNLRLEMDLRRGIERGEIKPRYQPIVSLRTGTIAGFEALARWSHPRLGTIMPGQFIPLAEKMGLIGAIGLRILADACRDVRQWQEKHPMEPPLFLTVNLSAVQLLDLQLASRIRQVLNETALPPDSLRLELTESVLMEDDPRMSRSLEGILGLGVRLIIDDFGTGYSSLSRLHQLPIEALKIDRSFVMGLVQSLDSMSIARAIVQLSRSFALKVTAEGVENVEQLDILKRMDCDFVQGHYFSQAIDPARAEQLLASGPRW